MIHVGDNRDILPTIPDASIDAIVTDPPYELGFMGKTWDSTGIAYNVEMWRECLRVLKPGGHLLAFGGSRTYHRLACAIEDAGFEIRDQIMWVYGSGFPKSLDVSKAIDKRGGAAAGFEEFRDAVKDAMKRNQVSRATLTAALKNHMLSHYLTARSQPAVPNVRDYRIIRDTVKLGSAWDHLFIDEAEREVVGTSSTTALAVAPGEGRDRQAVELNVTAPATDAAKEWEGWGTALKPAHEPIVLARKPLEGTVATNVLQHGTGAINIDGTRIAGAKGDGVWHGKTAHQGYGGGWDSEEKPNTDMNTLGRWPANLIHDGSDEVLQLFPDSKAGKPRGNRGRGGIWSESDGTPCGPQYGHSGSAARFFYCAKANNRDRNEGLDDLTDRRQDEKDYERAGTTNPRNRSQKLRKNHHPTVKPTDLMRYLCRLITPPGGLILDPFTGSGSTGKAAILEGFRFIGIEQNPEYAHIAETRIHSATQQQ